MSFSPRSTEDVVNNVDKFLVIPAGAGTTDRRAVNMGSTVYFTRGQSYVDCSTSARKMSFGWLSRYIFTTE